MPPLESRCQPPYSTRQTTTPTLPSNNTSRSVRITPNNTIRISSLRSTNNSRHNRRRRHACHDRTEDSRRQWQSVAPRAHSRRNNHNNSHSTRCDSEQPHPFIHPSITLRSDSFLLSWATTQRSLTQPEADREAKPRAAHDTCREHVCIHLLDTCDRKLFKPNLMIMIRPYLMQRTKFQTCNARRSCFCC